MHRTVVAVLAVVSIQYLHADQLTLVNGDRVTGKIVKKDGDTVSVKTDLMGEVTLKWKDVSGVTADAPLTVVLPGGRAVKGTVATSGSELVVRTDSGTEQAPLATVPTLRNADEQRRYERLLSPPWNDLWIGFVDFAIASAQGNARTLVYTTSMNANRVTSHDKTSLYFNQIYSRGLLDGRMTDTAKALRGGWAYNRNLRPRIFWNVFNDYEYDRFQNLDLRTVFGSGAGVNLFKRERGQLDVVLGGAWNREKYSIALAAPAGGEPRFVRNSGEAYWGDDLVWKLSSLSNLKQAFRMFNNLSRTGEYRANFDLGLDTRIMRLLSWQVTFSDRYITNPSPGRKTNDLLLSSGVRFTFSRLP